jgi:hypothetical protein
MNEKKFSLLRKKYGHYASWAIWADEGNTPTSNMENLDIFDIKKNPTIPNQLKPNIILVGLNISTKAIEIPLENFHGPNGGAFKIRYALKGTPFWGAYMTDIIKDFQEKSSGKMMNYLKTDKDFEEENVQTFRGELKDLEVDNPIIIAFGVDAHKILTRNLKEKHKIIKIPHYSMRISKENYRKKLKSILGF